MIAQRTPIIWLAFLLTIVCSSEQAAQAALKPGQPVTAVWSSATHLDLFATNGAGEVVSTYWDGGCGWQPWFPIHPEVKMQPGAAVSALWTDDRTRLDLFVTGTDGAVWSISWEAQRGWQKWLLIHPEIKMRPGATISALWTPDRAHLDLLATGTDGAVWTIGREAQRDWQKARWILIHPEIKMRPGAAVSALWAPDRAHLDLLATGTDGAVWTIEREAQRDWQKARWILIHPEIKMQPGATVSALWTPDRARLDLFVTGTDGAVWSIGREAQQDWRESRWILIHPEIKMQPGATVSALWTPGRDHLDLFVTGTDGAVWSIGREAQQDWQKARWGLIHPEIKMRPGAAVSALWAPTGVRLDLFATGTDGAVWSTGRDAARNWPWFTIFTDQAMARLLDPHNVLTQLHDNARTGSYLAETTLTPSTVSRQTFGKLYQRQVEGQILAQPLYLKNVNTKKKGRKNLLIVATAANMVYAFDADDKSRAPNSGLVFKTHLRDSKNHLQNSGPIAAIGECTETYPPYIGITATPVIDAVTNTMYTVAYSSGDQNHYLHALDLSDGLKDRIKPVMIEAPDSMISPEEKQQGYQFGPYQRNRPGLLLLNGVIYIGFGGFICDNPQPYAGWVFGYTKDLQRLNVWRSPQNVSGGAIWQSGRGLAGASDGSIYFMTGNDNEKLDPNMQTNLKRGTLGNSFVKLRGSCGPDLNQEGMPFEPDNSILLSKGDTDLGSSGPILVANRVIGGGKQGRVYVLNAKTMTLTQNTTSPEKFQGFQAFLNTYHGNPGVQACTNITIHYKSVDKSGATIDGLTRPTPDGGHPDKYCQNPDAILNGKPGFNWTEVCTYSEKCYLPPSCYQFCQSYGPNIHAGFVYWQPSPAFGFLYGMSEKDHLRQFRFDLATQHMNEISTKVSQFVAPQGMPGGALAVSANGTRDGIVWLSMPYQNEDATNGIHRGTILAADALDLHELWRDDCVRYFAKFNPPIIADGKVVLATFADPSRKAVPGRCDSPEPTIPTNRDHLLPGTAWLIVYGLTNPFTSPIGTPPHVSGKSDRIHDGHYDTHRPH